MVNEVIPVGIESMYDPTGSAGTVIERGSVDCIVTVLCLCSIIDHGKNIQALYTLLKPGDRWYVVEHEKFRADGFWNKRLGLYQSTLRDNTIAVECTDHAQHSSISSGLSLLAHVDYVARQQAFEERRTTARYQYHATPEGTAIQNAPTHRWRSDEISRLLKPKTL